MTLDYLYMKKSSFYKEDILKDGFEQRSIELQDDYEGEAVSILIRHLASTLSVKAILYIHGFNDYFFQSELAYKFNENGFNFYALDLRKYGRAYLPHQKMNDIRNLKDYYEEISKALSIIYSEGNREIILSGHSTGGLILTLFAKNFSNKIAFNGLILNSPFFEFNKSRLSKMLIPVAAFVGGIFPKLKIPGGFTKEYGENLHSSYSGEWDYNLEWKPNIPPKVNLGWVRAIYKAQKELKKGFSIQQPVLVLHSTKSVTDNENKNQMQSMDAILNVKDIERIARKIEGDVEIISISGGLHDLVLSKKTVRNDVYTNIFNWIQRHHL